MGKTIAIFIRRHILCLCVFVLLGLAGEVGAQGLLKPEVADKITNRASNFAGGAGFVSDQTPGEVVATLISAFLGLLGVIFIILMIIAGFNWMTAAGDEEKVRKAKSTIQRAIIGLIIVVSAYAITYTVFHLLPAGDGGPV